MAHLDRLGLFHMDFSLSRMEQALAALMPDRPDGPCAPVVQIVGTNGKGSTAAFLDRLLREHGLHTGLYTSPHLLRINERIRLSGVPLAAGQWPEPASAVYAACPDLTYFEFLTVLAVLVFTRADVDCLILEAGLGGRYDATTAIGADLVCFTPIAVDHAPILGPSLQRIAADKAQAMRQGGLALTAPQTPEVMRCLRAEAARKHCTLLETDAPLPGEPGPAGPHQRGNAALALAAWRSLAAQRRWPVDAQAESRGLARAFIPGRLQRVPAAVGLPPLLLDGAHNAHGLDSLILALDALRIRPRSLIFTCLADKDADAMLPRIRKLSEGCPVLVPGLPGNARARRAADLAVRLGTNARPCADARAALTQAAGLPGEDDDPITICGSLYLLGEVFRLFPHLLAEPCGISI